MSPDFITSANNSRLKQVRMLLQHSKRRRTEQRFVLEGVRLINDAMASGAHLDYVLVQENASAENEAVAALEKQLHQREIDYAVVERTLFDEFSDTETTQGVLAVSHLPEFERSAEPTFVLVLDAIADPGNLGTILRTAVAGGVEGVLLAPGCVDVYNPKVVRAAMGAHFRVAVQRMSWQEILAFELPLVLADAGTSTTIYDADLTQPLALVIGAEAHGFSDAACNHATQTISIPMVAGESLNAAMAATVIVYEVHRQRFYDARR